jgi:hypothetical protein
VYNINDFESGYTGKSKFFSMWKVNFQIVPVN